MTQAEKLAALEEMMELDEGILAPEADLASLDEWDSMSALSFVVLMSDEFDKKITGAQTRAFKTVQDMLDIMEK